MTNTLLASVTDVTDGTAAVSSADRSFYPEYGLASFRALTSGNYSPEVAGFNTSDGMTHIYDPSLFFSTMPGSFGSTPGLPSYVFSQPSGSAYGNYGNTVAFKPYSSF